MQRKNLETVNITAKSDIRAYISWEDSSTTNVSPTMYQTYIAPELTQWCSILKEADKPYVQHACGHVKHLLLPMANQGVAGIESITPLPSGNVTIEEAYRVLPEKVSIIGGIDPVHILNDSVEELLAYADELISTRGNRGLILGNSDSCPPGVAYEKFLALASFVKQR